MNNNITLQQLNYNEQSTVLDIILKDSTLKETFNGMNNTISRILNSSYVGLIKKDNSIVGFVMLVYNQQNDTHEVDMGIIKEYQNKGYGTIALKKLMKLIKGEDINVTIQVQKNNLSAIKTITNNNWFFIDEDVNNFYYSNKKKIRCREIKYDYW